MNSSACYKPKKIRISHVKPDTSASSKVSLLDRLQKLENHIKESHSKIMLELNLIKEECISSPQTSSKMLEGTKVPFSDLVNAPVPPPVSQKRVLDVKSDAIPLKKARLESWESTPNKFSVEPDGSILVYIHGARINRGSQAGIGVWFGIGNNLNISAPAKGRITINSAEIEAATAAIETAHSAGIKKLTLCSDSDFLVSAITKWIQKWQTNGWKTLFNEPVKNKKEFILLDKARKLLHVQFALVQPGNYGHDQAGALARTGASKCPPRRIF